jgi:Fibrobacter succinogenes major domain (Fib_succ_major).
MNFNTLEGRCIKKAEMNGSSLDITFMNGKSVTCDLAGVAAVTSLSFDYDRERGVLRVFVNGDDRNPIEVGGFFSEREMREYRAMGALTDGSIVGNGTMRHPLSVSRMLRPGMLRPVINYVSELPTHGMAAGDRYVTTETVDTYGALYNYRGVLNIMRALRGTGWRVARKDDWDDMLNALEPERADRNHHLHECNIYLGESANHYLADESTNFNLVYCGYAYEEEEPHVVFNGSRAGWWTGTHDDAKNAWMKRVDYMVDGVLQDIVDAENFYSVRLVRDLVPGDMLGAEEIMGRTYMTAVMPSMMKGLRVWTATNFASDLVPITEDYTEIGTVTECDGTQTTTETTVTDTIDDMLSDIYRPTEYPEGERVSFVCEWDGSKWNKQRIGEFTAFYVEELEGFYYLVGNDIVSILDATPADLSARVDALESDVSSLTSLFSNHEGRISELETVCDNNTEALESAMGEIVALGTRTDEAMNMAITATATSAEAMDTADGMEDRMNRLEREVSVLLRLYGPDMVAEYLKDAKAYTYDDYTYAGTITVDGASVLYTLSSEVFAYDSRSMMYDFGRFMGALYRTDYVDPIVYNGTAYSWDETLGLKGSNYKSEAGETLVHDIVSAFESGHNPDGSWDFAFAIERTDVNVHINLE